MILTIDKTIAKWKAHMWFWGGYGDLSLGPTWEKEKSTYIGQYTNKDGINTGKISFDNPALLRRIEDNYKFNEYFVLDFNSTGKYLCYIDEAFLVWLEKYGEDKWFKEQGGIKKAVAEIRKQIKEKTKS